MYILIFNLSQSEPVGIANVALKIVADFHPNE